jgi:F1F0 ATPase subunit 2
MTDIMQVAMAGIAGFFLGVFFFGGLWWTVQKGTVSTRPALWFFGSLLFRMSITLAGFYFASGGEWHRAASCLVGFLAGRLIVMWLTRLIEDGRLPLARGTHHAP